MTLAFSSKVISLILIAYCHLHPQKKYHCVKYEHPPIKKKNELASWASNHWRFDKQTDRPTCRIGTDNNIPDICNTCNKLLTQKLLKQGYQYHKLRKTLSKFYRRYYDLISKFQIGLKSLLRQGLSEPEFYGDLVYRLKKIVGSNNFSVQFIKIISHYKKIGYNVNVLQQTAFLVVNPITIGNFAFLLNCTRVGRTSDFMTVPT